MVCPKNDPQEILALFWWDLLCNLTLSHFLGRTSKKHPVSIWSIYGHGDEDNIGHGDQDGCEAAAAEAAAGEDDDFGEHDSDNPVGKCDKDCFEHHNNAYL